MPLLCEKEFHTCTICKAIKPTKRFIVCHGICRACKQKQTTYKKKQKIFREPMSKKEIALRQKMKIIEIKKRYNILNKPQKELTLLEKARCKKWAEYATQIADMIIPPKF